MYSSYSYKAALVCIIATSEFRNRAEGFSILTVALAMEAPSTLFGAYGRRGSIDLSRVARCHTFAKDKFRISNNASL